MTNMIEKAMPLWPKDDGSYKVTVKYETIIEKVARALARQDQYELDEALDFAQWHWEEYTDKAKAAIEAMREPSEGMRTAFGSSNDDGWIDRYNNMIDAALKE